MRRRPPFHHCAAGSTPFPSQMCGRQRLLNIYCKIKRPYAPALDRHSILPSSSLLEAHALPRASGPRQRTRNPRQRLCRGLPSAKTPRGIFRRRRGLCRGPGWPSAKKRGHKAPAPLAVSLLRAHPRQRNGFFFEFVCRGPTLGK